MKVSVVIPNYNGAKHLQKCLTSLALSTVDFELVIVDNGSSDESHAIYQASEITNKKWIALEKNYGFAKAVNTGIDAVGTQYTFLLNNDTELLPDTLEKLLEAIEQSVTKHLVAMQPLLLQMDNPTLIDNAGDTLSWYGIASKNKHGLPVTAAEARTIFSPSGGACLFDTFFLKTQKFDERFVSYLEDVDLGLRGRLLGYHYELEPSAVVYHKGHGSAIPQKQYVRNMTRNTMLLWSNLPAGPRAKNSMQLFYGQLHKFLSYGRPWQSILGYNDYFKLKFSTQSSTSLMKQKISLSEEEITVLLSDEFPSPSFLQVFTDFIYNIIVRPFFQDHD